MATLNDAFCLETFVSIRRVNPLTAVVSVPSWGMIDVEVTFSA